MAETWPEASCNVPLEIAVEYRDGPHSIHEYVHNGTIRKKSGCSTRARAIPAIETLKSAVEEDTY